MRKIATKHLKYLRGLKLQMSASREKQIRQEQASSGWVDPKVVREQEQCKKEKRSNILYGTIAVLFLGSLFAYYCMFGAIAVEFIAAVYYTFQLN